MQHLEFIQTLSERLYCMLRFAILNVRTTIFSTHFDPNPGSTFGFKTDAGLGLHCLKTKSIHMTFQRPVLLTEEF